MPRATAALARHNQPERHSGDRGVDAREVHEHPGRDAENDQQARDRCRPGAPAQPPEEEYDGHGGDQRKRSEIIGEEERDDEDGDEIIDHRESQQQGPDPRGKCATDERQRAERESDVRCRGDWPALGEIAVGHHEQEDRGRRDHSTHRGDGRHEGFSCAVELAVREFVLELDRGEEEENSEQPIGDPVSDGEIQPKPQDGKVRIPQALECRSERGIRENYAEDRGAKKKKSGITLASKEFHRAPDRIPPSLRGTLRYEAHPPIARGRSFGNRMFTFAGST